jgi:hypothetical protein
LDDGFGVHEKYEVSMKKSLSWFQTKAQQGVFMKIGTLRPISKSGSTPSISQRSNPKPAGEKYFEVGKSVIGEGQEVGDE